MGPVRPWRATTAHTDARSTKETGGAAPACTLSVLYMCGPHAQGNKSSIHQSTNAEQCRLEEENEGLLFTYEELNERFCSTEQICEAKVKVTQR